MENGFVGIIRYDAVKYNILPDITLPIIPEIYSESSIEFKDVLIYRVSVPLKITKFLLTCQYISFSTAIIYNPRKRIFINIL